MGILALILLHFIPSLVVGTATFSDCGGESKRISVNSGSIHPDPIQYPGNVSVTMDMNVLKDLPSDNFKMNLHLTKLEPTRMTVPCLENIGSCEYDVCGMLVSHKDILCPMFPQGMECKCPMKVGHYTMKDAPVAIPNFGEIFAKILKGNYEGNITFVDATTKEEVGCVQVTFEIVESP